MKKQRFTTLGLALMVGFGINGLAQEPDQLTDADLASARVKTAHVAPQAHLNGQAHARFGIPNIDSLVNFNDHFFSDGFDYSGNPNSHWYTNTVGNPPQHHGTTTINAPVIPVSLDLLDYDGQVRIFHGHPLHYDVTPYVQPTLNSPVFQNSTYSSSSVPTQITDAIQRAEHFNDAKDDWHTLLAPSLKPTKAMRIPRGYYRFSPNKDGSCCRYVLIDFNTFVYMFQSVTYGAEISGDVTTKDISTFLFPNTFLYFGIPAFCCAVGYHTYDYEPGDASNGNVEKRYVLNYSSWISPGLFDGFAEDITTLSHEIAEIFNDPFVAADGVHNVTPWWLAPGNGGCADILENADVIAGLANGRVLFPITMNGMTYHPQNVALLQWFEFRSPSDALHGAYSYPDEAALTALSAPQKAGCQP